MQQVQSLPWFVFFIIGAVVGIAGFLVWLNHKFATNPAWVIGKLTKGNRELAPLEEIYNEAKAKRTSVASVISNWRGQGS